MKTNSGAHVAGIGIGLIFSLGLLIGLWIGSGEKETKIETGFEWATSGLFESQGAVTLGCALWDPPNIRPYTDNELDVRPLADYYIVSSPNNTVLVAARTDGVATVSGLRCGISIDWRRFPTSPRPTDP